MASTRNMLVDFPERGEGDGARAQLLIEAAYELLDDSGLEGLTIRAVLAKAGLARRAFYDCFQGKDDLVLAVFESSLRSAGAHFRAMTAGCEGPEHALEQVVKSLVMGQLGYAGTGGEGVGSNRRGAALSREHMRLAQARPLELAAALKPLLDVLSEQVRDGIAQGAFRDADPQVQATLIYNLVSTTIHTVLLTEEDREPEPAEREALAGTLWEFCRRAIVV